MWEGGGGAVVLEGVAILKQAPYWGVNFSLVRKHEGVKFYDSNSSLGNLTSVIYPRSRGWGKGKNFDAISCPEGRVV